jgi:hypothetical protein
MELMGDRVYAAERIMKKRVRRVSFHVDLSRVSEDFVFWMCFERLGWFANRPFGFVLEARRLGILPRFGFFHVFSDVFPSLLLIWDRLVHIGCGFYWFETDFDGRNGFVLVGCYDGVCFDMVDGIGLTSKCCDVFRKCIFKAITFYDFEIKT